VGIVRCDEYIFVDIHRFTAAFNIEFTIFSERKNENKEMTMLYINQKTNNKPPIIERRLIT